MSSLCSPSIICFLKRKCIVIKRLKLGSRGFHSKAARLATFSLMTKLEKNPFDRELKLGRSGSQLRSAISQKWVRDTGYVTTDQ